MLVEGYFDDSGTHGDSEVVVWGGLVGRSNQWEYLDRKWRELLAKPPYGRPPLRRFHLVDAAHGWGEFEGYSDGERDHIRWAFRQIIHEANLAGSGWALSTGDWNAVVRGRLRKLFPSPELICAGACVPWVFNAAEEAGEEFVLLAFDKGRLEQVPGVAEFINKVAASETHRATLIDIGFHAIIDTPALQAADVIATETYWWAKTLYAGNPAVSAHFTSLLGKTHVSGNVMTREKLKALVARLNKKLGR